MALPAQTNENCKNSKSDIKKNKHVVYKKIYKTAAANKV